VQRRLRPSRSARAARLAQVLVTTALAAAAALAARDAAALERRQDQFPRDSSYLLLPLPYSIPGIGSGLMLTALAGKIGGTDVDLFAIQAFGDAQGTVVGLQNLPIVDRLLYLELQHEGITKAAVQAYDQRGMRTGRRDYRLTEFNEVREDTAKLRLSLWDRRLELTGEVSYFHARIPRVRDADGDIIAELDPEQTETERTTRGRATLDLTDDRADPRRGVRLETVGRHALRETTADPDLVVVDVSATGYVPVLAASTFVVNAFRSDALVRRTGDLDEERVRRGLGYACGEGDDACLAAERDATTQALTAHRRGGASSLGGRDRLRAYPDGRFFAAKSAAAGAELRWNVHEGVAPFDFFLWRDVAAALQLAAFYEVGSTFERDADFGRDTRASTGVGLRMVSSSGMVYRADYARGDEGGAFVLFFGYPW
jgi:hypothetical protein